MSHNNPPLHPSTHRKQFSSLTSVQRVKLRQLIDTYIATQNPVDEHLAAQMNPGLMIHDMGFLGWHYVFIGKLENWLVVNGGGEFVPLPYWDPATPIPAELEKRMAQTRADYELWLDARYAAARGQVDALIDPLATRRVLAFAFDAACAHGQREHLVLETL